MAHLFVQRGEAHSLIEQLRRREFSNTAEALDILLALLRSGQTPTAVEYFAQPSAHQTQVHALSVLNQVVQHVHNQWDDIRVYFAHSDRDADKMCGRMMAGLAAQPTPDREYRLWLMVMAEAVQSGDYTQILDACAFV